VKAVIAWWDLAGSPQTIASLREALHRDGTQDWASLPGLVTKFWISDPTGPRWGAVMLFESAEHARRPLPPNRAAELIGGPPTVRLVADVEAFVAGPPTPGGDRPWP
jgi:hypothetical protein